MYGYRDESSRIHGSCRIGSWGVPPTTQVAGQSQLRVYNNIGDIYDPDSQEVSPHFRISGRHLAESYSVKVPVCQCPVTNARECNLSLIFPGCIVLINLFCMKPL
jgi:hypothetical protein